MKNMKELEVKFNEIKSDDKLHIDIKNRALSSLMTEIERDYNFPLMGNDLTEGQLNSEIYKLYLDISNARNFENSYYNEID